MSTQDKLKSDPRVSEPSTKAFYQLGLPRALSSSKQSEKVQWVWEDSSLLTKLNAKMAEIVIDLPRRHSP